MNQFKGARELSAGRGHIIKTVMRIDSYIYLYFAIIAPLDASTTASLGAVCWIDYCSHPDAIMPVIRLSMSSTGSCISKCKYDGTRTCYAPMLLLCRSPACALASAAPGTPCSSSPQRGTLSTCAAQPRPAPHTTHTPFPPLLLGLLLLLALLAVLVQPAQRVQPVQPAPSLKLHCCQQHCCLPQLAAAAAPSCLPSLSSSRCTGSCGPGPSAASGTPLSSSTQTCTAST